LILRGLLDIAVDPSVRERWEGDAVLAACRFDGCSGIGPQEAAELAAAMAGAAEEVRGQGRAVLGEPRVRQVRATFKSMPDMDPSRYRPASESLLRRLLDADFFRISPLVDANNLLSVRLRLPLGIYDLDRVPLAGWTYRLGHPGESYRTFSRQEKSAGGKLVLADRTGIFGSPVADSGRAPIAPASSNVAVVAYLPRGLGTHDAAEILEQIAAVFQAWFEPARVERCVVGRL
jgi:DNA/RNA-binding domain of Phe-tRNA-synthetase-like protein